MPELENQNGWHGKALPPEMAERAVAALGGPTDLRIATAVPEPGTPRITPDQGATVTLPSYALGEKVATRVAFGAALAALAARPEVVVLDGEVGNSTHAEDFQKVCPERYFEMFIAEQQLVTATVGLSVRGYLPFAATFAAFTSRAYDFIRMAGISQVNIALVGSHAGVEIGADGPPRWPWRTSPPYAPCTPRSCCIPRTQPPPPNSCARWPKPPASSTSVPPAARIR